MMNVRYLVNVVNILLISVDNSFCVFFRIFRLEHTFFSMVIDFSHLLSNVVK